MNASEASRILELAPDASPDAVERRFFELRTKLEDKIARAPTPGLKEKYRASLNQVTQAFETLVLAAEAASLPVLHQVSSPPPPPTRPIAEPARPSPATSPALAATAPAATRPSRPAATKRTSHEFGMVVVVAILVLGLGGWWVVKTRSETTAKAEATARKAADDAEAARLAAAAKKLEEETAQKKLVAERAEKERLDAEAKVRQAEVDKLTAQLRTEVAEGKIAWEKWEKEERQAERDVSELKGELRSLRDAPRGKANELNARLAIAQRYYDWLRETLERHPARVARAKAEELLSARMPEEADIQLRAMREAFDQLAREVPAQRSTFRKIQGSLRITSDPAGLAVRVIDAFGLVRDGTTPVTFQNVSPGRSEVTVVRPRFHDVVQAVEIATGKTAAASLSARSQPLTVTVEKDVQIWSKGRLLATGQYTFVDQPPGTYDLELRRPGSAPWRTSVAIDQSKPNPPVQYSFTALAAQVIVCTNCNGQGKHTHDETCAKCNGETTTKCIWCGGAGEFRGPGGQADCPNCTDGRVACRECRQTGRVAKSTPCTRCAGDGRLSKIDTQ
jgi:hypothetical protein